MKKSILSLAATTVLLSTSLTAGGSGWGIGAGILGGTILGAAITAPRTTEVVYAPAPAVVQPMPYPVYNQPYPSRYQAPRYESLEQHPSNVALMKQLQMEKIRNARLKRQLMIEEQQRTNRGKVVKSRRSAPVKLRNIDEDGAEEIVNE